MPAPASDARVLIVDDEPAVRKFAATVLRGDGYAVFEAEDGQAAYELMQQHRGDIQFIVTDIRMPRMDGITLGRKISAEYPNVEVLYISAYPLNSNEQIPANRFLPKPFRRDDLLQGIPRLSG